MIVQLHADDTVTLEDPDNFSAFSVRAGGRSTTEIVQTLSRGIGESVAAMDDDHAWIPISGLRALGAIHGGPDWQAGCDAMLEYATGKGWVDDTTACVRAHLDR